MTIRKFRAGRVANADVSTWVGEVGTLFYDEVTGQLKIADGTTPGGHYINLVVATTTQLGGIKAGPGANVAVDGTLTIDTTGLPLSVGDLFITGANISAIHPNENLNLVTNGTGDINMVGNLHVHTTAQGPDYATPILSADNYGNVTVNGNLITNGGTYHNGSVTFVGATTHTGNLITNGNVIVNGASFFIGNITEIGNLTIVGNAVNNGQSIFNGNTIFNGNSIRNGATVSTGNVTWNGTTVTNGQAINNGPTTFNGNIITNGVSTINGNTTQNGNIHVFGEFHAIGPLNLDGNITINGTAINNGPSIFNGAMDISGDSILSGNVNILVPVPNSLSGAVSIIGNNSGLYQSPIQTGVMLQITGQQSDTSRIYIDAVNNYNVITGRRYNGTPSSPTGVKAGNIIVRYGSNGMRSDGTWNTGGVARMEVNAIEDFTPTSQASNIVFYTTAVGSTTATPILVVDSANGISSTKATVTGNVTAGNVTATTFYGNSVGSNATYSGGTTANISYAGVRVTTAGGIKSVVGGTPTVTLNFGTDSIVHVYQPVGAVTFQYGTLVAGSSIDCLVNLATAQTITFGVSATNNSTDTKLGIGIGGGTPAAKANQAVHLRYVCVDGTAANTYCISTYT